MKTFLPTRLLIKKTSSTLSASKLRMISARLVYNCTLYTVHPFLQIKFTKQDMKIRICNNLKFDEEDEELKNVNADVKGFIENCKDGGTD